MKRIVLWLLSTISALVLLFSFGSSTAGALPGMSAVPDLGTRSKAGKAAKPAVSTSKPNARVPVPDPTKGAITHVLGRIVKTRWGPVEVQLEIQNDKIVAVTLLKKPGGNSFSDFINDRATPVLINETVDAQGSAIDMVTGATFTSAGYLSSLQSALDTAGR